MQKDDERQIGLSQNTKIILLLLTLFILGIDAADHDKGCENGIFQRTKDGAVTMFCPDARLGEVSDPLDWERKMLADINDVVTTFPFRLADYPQGIELRPNLKIEVDGVVWTLQQGGGFGGGWAAIAETEDGTIIVSLDTAMIQNPSYDVRFQPKGSTHWEIFSFRLEDVPFVISPNGLNIILPSLG